jgi:hypothetical protein
MPSGTASGATCLTAEGLDAFSLPVRAIARAGVDLRIGDPIGPTGVVRTGEALRSNPAHCAAATFEFTPRCHRWVGWGPVSQSQVLATAGTIVWGARFEEPRYLGRDNAGREVLAALPDPRQPDQRHHEQQHQPTRIAQHRQPHGTICSRTGDGKDTEDGWSGQVFGKPGTELSTISRGSTYSRAR